MPKQPQAFVSDLEVPNRPKLEEAQDFHEAARILRASRRSASLSFYVMGGLALETYLKALNSPWEYPRILAGKDGKTLTYAPEGLSLSDYIQNPSPRKKVHDLILLFEKLDGAIREGLVERYAAAPVVPGLASFEAALNRYQNTFVHARSPSEAGHGLPDGSPEDLLLLLDFLGGYVTELHANNPNTKLREQIRTASTATASEVEPAAQVVVHAGRIESNAVQLDSGETLPDETIVDVWRQDEAEPAEVGVVSHGVIRLEWPGSIPEGTKVNVEVAGKLLSFAEIDPAFKIGELAVDAGVPDLARNIDHHLYGHPKVEDR